MGEQLALDRKLIPRLFAFYLLIAAATAVLTLAAVTCWYRPIYAVVFFSLFSLGFLTGRESIRASLVRRVRAILEGALHC